MNNELHNSSVVVNLNETDSKGRAVSKTVTLREFVPTCHYSNFQRASIPEGSEILRDSEWGVAVRRGPNTFEVQVWTQRDGKTFGATPRGTYFATLAEAQAAVAKKVAALQKKAAKNALCVAVAVG